MDLEVFEEGFGRVQLTREVPGDLLPHLMVTATPLVLLGNHLRALLLEFSGDGFQAWFNRLWAAKPVVVSTRGELAVLELRVAWRHRIKGTWDQVEEPSLPPQFFQLAFTPFIQTRAILEAAVEYQTFDVHFTLPYLEAFGLEYKMMERFIASVHRDEAAALAPRPYKCNKEMVQLIQYLLDSEYSPAGKKLQLHHHIASILTAALEIVSVAEGVKLPLTQQDKEALHAVRQVLDTEPVDEYPGNDYLLRQVRPHLNTWKLNYGFKQLFGTNPKDYFLGRRFSEAQQMLAKGDKIVHVAHWLGYGSATTFGKEFRKRFGVSPKEWRMHH
jgi:AraC-like DNA-binding protein